MSGKRACHVLGLSKKVLLVGNTGINPDPNRTTPLEPPGIVYKRRQFLLEIKKHRDNQENIVYLDETWVNTHTYLKRRCLAPIGQCGPGLHADWGKRFVVVHCGGERSGFLPGCELVLENKTNDGRDNHSMMNGSVFSRWVRSQLVPALPPCSVIVMDNASYHSVQAATSKPPTSATKKADMQQWLRDQGVRCDDRMTRARLYELIKLKKAGQRPVYQVDTYLQQHGHQVLRLPPYHMELNPLELIWTDVKQYVARNISSLTGTDVRQLIAHAIAQTDRAAWQRCCEHVRTVEQRYWKQDSLQ